MERLTLSPMENYLVVSTQKEGGESPKTSYFNSNNCLPINQGYMI